MVELTRKQRELAEREAKILALARPILLREGYNALSMDRLAILMEYAKGTIYNHFPNKEDIVLALALQSMQLRFALFEYGASLGGHSRGALMGVGAACEVYRQRAPSHFAIEAWIRNSMIWDKSSNERQELTRIWEGHCMSVVSGVARRAIQEGALRLPDSMTAEEMIFGFWSLSYGSQVLAATSPSLQRIGVRNAPFTNRQHCYTLLNGYQWQPIEPFEIHDQQMASMYAQIVERFQDRLDPDVGLEDRLT
jgi:AcrR family transcriptional regulator